MKKNMTSKWWDDQLVTDAVANSESLAQVIRFLGLAESGTTYSSAKRHIGRLNLSTSHFRPIESRRVPKRLSNSEIFTEDSKASRSTARNRVIEQELIEYKCSKCENDGIWQGTPISLQLEHKNGVRNDHRLENLEFLCPNCHSQTTTWGSRNSKVMVKSRRKFGSREDYTKVVIEEYLSSQEENIRKVEEANIQFGQYGWSKQVANILGIQPQRVKRWMLRCMPEVYDNHCR